MLTLWYAIAGVLVVVLAVMLVLHLIVRPCPWCRRRQGYYNLGGGRRGRVLCCAGCGHVFAVPLETAA